MNRIICTFREQNNQVKSCDLVYGPCQQNKSFNLMIQGTLMSRSSPNVIIINLSSQLQSSGYCYIIKADNGTFTTQIEGVFGKIFVLMILSVCVCVCVCVYTRICVHERERKMIKRTLFLPSHADTNEGRRNTTTALIVGIIVPLLIIILAIVAIAIVIIWKPWKRRRNTITLASMLIATRL